MGCTVKQKHIRANRKLRSPKSDSDVTDKALANKSSSNTLNSELGFDDSPQNHNSSPRFEDTDWGYCTKAELEDILMKNLEFMYNEAIVKLVDLGYDEEVALRAVLRNGYCYGGMDVLTNILNNSLAFLNSRSNGNDGDSDENDRVFADLKELEEYSLACMVRLLRRLKPHLSKGDAMWCLFMSDLRVGRASVMEIPNNSEFNGHVMNNMEKMNDDSVGVTPDLCRFHGGWGFENGDKTGCAEMFSKFNDLNLEEEDQKDDMILSFINQITDLEKQVNERKEWAHEKAMQAAKKLSNDLNELKTLRMEKEESQSLKQGKSTVEDKTMKKLSDMETALRKASVQVDRANAAVKRLEIENAEIRAEMEASKLSASESVNSCLEVSRREKKYLKKLLACEKQSVKLQDDIAAEKQRIIELQEEMVRVGAEKKAAEARWKQEQKAKEHALAQVEEERRAKEATEANNNRKQETLLSKIELDFKRHKDDLQRLEQELRQVKLSTGLDNNQSTYESTVEISNGPRPTIARLLHELDEKESGIGRECIVCLKNEVCVVFLPCAHEVVCATCSDAFGRKGKVMCPICRVVIEQRIRVFGASS